MPPLNDIQPKVFQHSYLCIKYFPSFDWVGGAAEYEAGRYVRLVDALQLDFDVLPAGDALNRTDSKTLMQQTF